ILVRGASLEEPDVGDHAEEQGQLGRRGQIALAIDDGLHRVESAGHVGAQHVEGGPEQVAPLRNRGEGVVVRDEVVAALVLLLKLDKALDGAKIVAVMEPSGRTDPGEDDFLGRRHAEIPFTLPAALQRKAAGYPNAAAVSK